MELSKILVALLAASSAFASSEETLRALYMMQNGRILDALERYQESYAKGGRHDFEALQQMGLVLLKRGIQSEDPDTFTMSLLGAGLSGSSGSLEILERGLLSPDPQMQMMALHFIARIDDDRTDELLKKAMASDFLSTRMEAAFFLARRKHPHAVGHIESLMVRLPPFFRPFFPSLFALIGTNDATAALRRLMDDLDPQVRVEAILNIARTGRDDFLPQLRKRLSHTLLSEVEAVAYAIGTLKDSNSLVKLKRLAQSPSPNVKIAAIHALYQLGDRNYVYLLEELARSHNLFAIAALGFIPGYEETLAPLVHSTDLQVRLNAAVSLLLNRDPRCVPALLEILIHDARDLAFYPIASLGRTLSILKAVPSAELRHKDPTLDFSLSLSIREQLLHEALHLPQAAFLNIAKAIAEKHQTDLIPVLIGALENLATPEALAFLKEGCGKIAFPLLRDYCYLALFRMKEEGPYEEYINHWVMQQKDADLIRLRPILPWKMRLESDYVLTTEETSRLLVDAFMAIASRQNEKSIGFLLDAIKQGNPQNRYALFGLLMRATE